MLKKNTFNKLVTILCIGLFTGSFAFGQQPVSLVKVPGEMRYKYKPISQNPPKKTGLARSLANNEKPCLSASSTFVINYNGSSWTDESRYAFEVAVSNWARIIETPIPIVIDATFEPIPTPAGFPPNTMILGGAKATSNFLFSDNYFRPSALANKLYGGDLDPNVSDITISFNSDWTWDFNTAEGIQSSFTTVVMHEIAHGLGFASSAGKINDTDTYLSYGLGYNYVGGVPTQFKGTIYDKFLRSTYAPASLISSYTPGVPSAYLTNAFKSNKMYWNGINGNNARLKSPSTFLAGTSISHLDDATYDGTVNELMTSAADSRHTPGPIARGMLKDMGWSLTPEGYTYVPDDVFENHLISLGLDNVMDNYVLTSNIASITSLSMSRKGIQSLQGIQDFHNLTSLNVTFNSISKLDVSCNTLLTSLSCDFNDISSLDLKSNPNLVHVGCSSNNLTNLDVTNCPNMVYLGCSSNLLTYLNVNYNPLLKEIYCDNNQLYDLWTYGLTSIETISCSNNNIYYLYLVNNSTLKDLFCYNNPISNLYLGSINKIETLQCFNNNLNSLNTSNLANLKWIDCSNNVLTSLDLSLNPKLTFVKCSFNHLTSLNVKNGFNTNITNFNSQGNNFINGLSCILVDNVNYSNTHWFNKDSFSTFISSWSACGTNQGSRAGEFTESYEIELYPTDFSEELILSTNEDSFYTIYSASGESVMNGTVSKGDISINTSNLNIGFYIITVISSKGEKTSFKVNKI